MAVGKNDRKVRYMFALKKYNEDRFRNIFVILAILFISFITLAICSKSSFLYPINDWGDANIYFDIAKGIIHGMVPFRDLYDQKGPFIYFIYALGVIFDERDFLGIFILEIIAASVFLYFVYKSVKLYCKSDMAFFSIPLIAFAVYSSKSFCHGGSAEEFILPMYMMIFYKWLVFTDTKELKKLDALLIGILTGIIFWTKFTLITLSGFFGLYILFVFLIEKKYKSLINSFVYFILGAFIPTLTVFAYFGMNKSLKYLWDGYFYNNIFYYGHESAGILTYLWWYKKHIPEKNSVVFLLFCIGLFYLLIIKRKFKLLLLNIGVFAIIYLTLYAGGNCYDYYPLVVSICCVFGCAAIVEVFESFYKKFKMGRSWGTVLFLLVSILSLLGAGIRTSNRYLLLNDKNTTAQYRFANRIMESGSDDPSIYVYNIMDRGFYQAMNQLPSSRFFCRTNLYTDELEQSQNENVREKKYGFVVTKLLHNPDENANVQKFIKDSGYKEVDRVDSYFEQEYDTYLLYMRE